MQRRQICILITLVLLQSLLTGQVHNRSYMLPETYTSARVIDQSCHEGWSLGVTTWGNPIYSGKQYVVEINYDGTLKWQTVISERPEEHFALIRQLSQGRVLVVTKDINCLPSLGDFILLDSTGTILWRNTVVDYAPTDLVESVEQDKIYTDHPSGNTRIIHLATGSVETYEVEELPEGVQFLSHYPGRPDWIMFASASNIIVQKNETTIFTIPNLVSDGPISDLQTTPDGKRLFIRTSSQVYLMDENGQLDSISLRSGDQFYLSAQHFAKNNVNAPQEVQVFEYHSPNHPVDTLLITGLSEFVPLGFHQIHAIVSLIGVEYNGKSYRSSIRWARMENNRISSRNTSDIGVVEVIPQERVWAVKDPDWGFYQTEPFTCKAVVKNFGADTIKTLTLNAVLRASSHNCDLPRALSRQYTGLNLLPGQEMLFDFDIDQYVFLEPRTGACMWASYPNEQPDNNHYNDYWCSGAWDFTLPTPDRVRIFPNPVQHQLFISVPIEAASTIRISVYNIQGYLVKYELVSKTLGYFLLDVSGLYSGLYYLEIGSIQYKFVKI